MIPAALKRVKISAQNKPFTDVVGLELGSVCNRGVPAVRLRKREAAIELMAADFLSLPGELPQTPNTGGETSVWVLPRAFHAPHAALTISAPQAFLMHASETGDDIVANKPCPYRTASRVLVPELPPLTAGIPEFQAAWAAKLLPEGRQPTACSLQVSPASVINTFLSHPTLNAVGGVAVVLFVFDHHTSLAAFHDFRLILYREHPIGYGHLREAICSQMKIDASIADSLLEDNVIDPTPMIEPVLRNLFRQVEISYDYLTRRRNCQTKNFFLCGLPVGAKYWATIFSRMLNLPLTPFNPFEGLKRIPKGLVLPNDFQVSAPFLNIALGAALAVLEDA